MEKTKTISRPIRRFTAQLIEIANEKLIVCWDLSQKRRLEPSTIETNVKDTYVFLLEKHQWIVQTGITATCTYVVCFGESSWGGNITRFSLTRFVILYRPVPTPTIIMNRKCLGVNDCHSKKRSQSQRICTRYHLGKLAGFPFTVICDLYFLVMLR